MSTFVESGRQALTIEIEALENLAPRIDESFAMAGQIILESQGKVVVIGMGKSGHIAKKIAATLASTGTPAFYVHPGEASHGDLGMIGEQDVVIAISNSGETSEVTSLLPLLKRKSIPIISMTGKPQSTLSSNAQVNLNIAVEKEACPLNLAPTSSTTATLAMGDALAVALLEARGFTEADFAYSHPGGSLGKKLLLHVSDVMVKGEEIPMIPSSSLVRDALIEISAKGLGMVAIVNESGQLQGVFTDGDLRRMLDHVDIKTSRIEDVMTKNCITIKATSLAVDALNILDEKRINGLFVVDEQMQVVGALNMHN
ncbi:MAG: KpsF/GutQ family sugar-phosphate isomerase, partial [Pseudomonadota bacterium]|nr:KpsF/GutQ family sugar-phosphate isomerase [Pseudomonadota bacterium]